MFLAHGDDVETGDPIDVSIEQEEIAGVSVVVVVVSSCIQFPAFVELIEMLGCSTLFHILFTIFIDTIMHLVYTPKFDITIVSSVSLVLQSSLEKSKTMVMQNFGV